MKYILALMMIISCPIMAQYTIKYKTDNGCEHTVFLTEEKFTVHNGKEFYEFKEWEFKRYRTEIVEIKDQI